jgi:hypothetical protein
MRLETVEILRTLVHNNRVNQRMKGDSEPCLHGW